MKKLITNYTFNASAKTIAFNDYTTISLKNILLITNTTSNVIIYNFASLGGTVSGNVLTLTYNTTSMSNSDNLQIFYDDGKITSDNYENPFGTNEGQVVASQSEGFWQRLAREGRFVCDSSVNSGGYSAGSLHYWQGLFKPDLNCVLYPNRIDFTATTSILFYLYIHTGLADSTGDPTYFGFLKAYTPYVMDLSNTGIYMIEGGTVEMRVLGVTAGQLNMTINGIEVARND